MYSEPMGFGDGVTFECDDLGKRESVMIDFGNEMAKGEVRKEWTVSLMAAFWLIYESGNGIMQVLGVARSGHVLYPLTGHFQNPGPLGGFVAMLMSICLSQIIMTEGRTVWQRWIKWICAVAAAMGFIVFPASMSRAGWLGLAVSMSVLSCRNQKVQRWFTEKSFRRVGTFAVLIIIGVGGFLLKKDSALGRIHVWHMELLAMSKAPLTGVGTDRFAWVYGETQANYFSAAERSLWEVRVAGCPEYAFNEYLKAGVEWGVMGLFLVLGLSLFVCIILARKANPLGYGAIALAVFAFFSYPLSLWQFRVWVGLFLAAAVSEVLINYKWIPYGIFLAALCVVSITKRSKTYESDYRMLYQQGYAMFLVGEYEKALPLLQEGATLSCDPMFHNIIGRCHEALGYGHEAEREYLHAHNMVPGRLYPLVLLQELYLSQGEIERAGLVLEQIRRIPVNPRNKNMYTLRERAENNHVSNSDVS